MAGCGEVRWGASWFPWERILIVTVLRPVLRDDQNKRCCPRTPLLELPSAGRAVLQIPTFKTQPASRMRSAPGHLSGDLLQPEGLPSVRAAPWHRLETGHGV